MAKRVRFAQRRKAVGYTQESFAEELRVDRSTVVRWEAGTHEPLAYLRPKMARLLGVSRDGLTRLLWPQPPVRVAALGSRTGSETAGSGTAGSGGPGWLMWRCW